MAQERTEQATPKRQSKARKEGKVAKSQDYNMALVLIFGCALFYLFAPIIFSKLKVMLYQTFTNLHPSQIPDSDPVSIFSFYMNFLSDMLVPFLISLFLASAIFIGIQMKGLFTLDPLKPKLKKFAPNELMKRLVDTFNIFKPQKLVELLKSFVKLFVICAFAWAGVKNRQADILGMLGMDVESFFIQLSSILGEIVFNILLAMLIIGIFDKIYQKYEFDKSLKMTKQEVKDERKNAEGDPVIKSKIRSIQMQMAQSRMMSNVPTADVVVTNPTHYAVAIRYDTTKAPAPQVIAKGADYVAFRIREVAQNNDITIVENPPLARTLYKLVPLDGIIPAELYTAVAEVLAFVYRKKQGGRL